jgi:lysophospholipase L1-like esterase
MLRKLSLVLLILTASFAVSAQNVPFYNEVQTFKKQDSLKFPPKNAVLFVGSSTFTKWTDVQQYFPQQVIINRGFGGSSLPDLIYFTKEVIFPYQPKQIVIYCGENDFMSNATAETVAERVKQLFSLIRSKYPKVALAYISIKPSPSREKYWPEMKKANHMIAELIKKTKEAVYINTADVMFKSDGTIMADIFLADKLHMNAKGYAIWQKVMAPYLK